VSGPPFRSVGEAIEDNVFDSPRKSLQERDGNPSGTNAKYRRASGGRGEEIGG
jgi:hypothetical protein